jgi:cell division protein ZipA
MSLRLTLLCAGLVILICVFLYTRGSFQSLFARRPKLPSRKRSDARQEPLLDSDGGAIDAALESAEPEPQAFGRLHQVGQVEQLDDEPVNPPATRPLDDYKVFAIRLVPEHEEGFAAERLILALRAEGLAHGELGIFHQVDANGRDAGTFCVANLVEPGSFDLMHVHEAVYPGVSLFMMLPMRSDGVAAFDDMLAVARSLAGKLDGILLDEAGSRLSVQRERYLREEVIDYERRQQVGNYPL